METAPAAAHCKSESALVRVCRLALSHQSCDFTLKARSFLHVNFPELWSLGASRGFPALLSQTQPKLAPSGRLVFTVSPKTMSSYQKRHVSVFVQLLGGRTAFIWTISWICVAWPHFTPFFRVPAWSVCLHALSIRPRPPTSTRKRALKDTSTFTVSKPSLLLKFDFLLRRVRMLSMLYFLPCSIWLHQSWNMQLILE